MFWTTTRRSQPQICRILLRITFFPSRVIWKQQRLVGFYAACFEVRPRLRESSWIEKVCFFLTFLGRWHIHVLVPDLTISVVIFFKREEDKESTNGLATFVFLFSICRHFAGCLRYQLWIFNASFAAHKFYSAKFIQSWKSPNAAVYEKWSCNSIIGYQN